MHLLKSKHLLVSDSLRAPKRFRAVPVYYRHVKEPGANISHNGIKNANEDDARFIRLVVRFVHRH